MKYKDGVIIKIEKFVGDALVILTPSNEIVFALQMAEVISKEQFNKEIVVTSLLDSIHSKGSLHYGGNACDLRSYIYSEEEIEKLLIILRNTVGKDYDILYELEPAHIHIEYDPK